MSQARLSHSHCIWEMHVLEWNDTDDAFEVDGDGDGADDRLDDELSKSVKIKMPEAIPESICSYFFCEIKEAVLVNDYLQKKNTYII